jgi:hypothetical protein
MEAAPVWQSGSSAGEREVSAADCLRPRRDRAFAGAVCIQTPQRRFVWGSVRFGSVRFCSLL